MHDEILLLTDADRALIRKTARDNATASPPRDPSVPGCLLAFAGMILLTVTPGIGGFVAIPRVVVLSVFAFAILLLFLGAGVSIAGRGASLAAWSRSRVDGAVGPILAWAGADAAREGDPGSAEDPAAGEEGGDGSAETRTAALRSGVLLLLHVWHAGPHGLERTVDPDEVADRLGSRGTALLRAVEDELRAASNDGTGTPGLPRPFLTGPGGATPGPGDASPAP